MPRKTWAEYVRQQKLEAENRELKQRLSAIRALCEGIPAANQLLIEDRTKA
jgi:hypothetical protein